MTLLVSALVFILGTAIGSFLSVVIYRHHADEKGIFLGHSYCPACKKRLKWRYLVPVLSWLFLRGKCGYCGKKISVHYLMLELITGIAFLTIFLYWNFLTPVPSVLNSNFLNYSIDWNIFQLFLFYLIEFSLMIGIFFYDLMYKEIPDSFSVTAFVIAVAGGLIYGTPKPLDMLIGAVALFAFFAVQYFISNGKWIGGGDLRLGALMGALLGWEKGLLALIVGYILGAIFSIYLLIAKRADKKAKIALGPFLIIGMTIAIFYGDRIMAWYLGII